MYKKGQLWSDHMEDILNKSVLRGAEYPNVSFIGIEQNIGEVWHVTSIRKGLSFIHKVIVPVLETTNTSHPYCLECGYYLSTWAPCGHIASVFSRKSEKLKDIKNIHPYYHLSNHPLYSAAHKLLGIIPPISNPSLIQIGVEETQIEIEETDSTIQSHIPKVTAHMFSSVVYPTQGKVRIAKLRERFDAVANLAENCEARYKHFVATLIEEENILRNMTELQLSQSRSTNISSLPHQLSQSRSTSISTLVLPPLTRIQKRHIRNKDLDNLSTLNKKKRISTVPKTGKRHKCSVCKLNKRFQPDDDVHVKGKGCPYYLDQNHAITADSNHDKNDSQDDQVSL